MSDNIKNLKLCLKIDEKVIYEFSEKINEQSIIKSATYIEKLLIENNVESEKIKIVFELMVEVMQNMLNYSHGNIDLDNNKKEAYGTFVLSYDSKNNTYMLQSCNLIKSKQEDSIKGKLDSISGLDNQELRKLAREKMKSKEDNHKKGAGLGFIMMARKCSAPIQAEFIPYEKGIVQYILKLII